MSFLRILHVPWLNCQAFLSHPFLGSFTFLPTRVPNCCSYSQPWSADSQELPKSPDSFVASRGIAPWHFVVFFSFSFFFSETKLRIWKGNSEAPQVRNNINHDSFHLPGWTLWMAYLSRFLFKEHLLLFPNPCNEASLQLQLSENL